MPPRPRTPGFTRTLQEVSLDAKVTLIDCPGIIFDDDGGAAAAGGGAFGGSDAGAGLLLRNCVSVDAIEDPEGAVDAILRRCVPAKLVALYGISMYDGTADFLRQVAAKRGKLGKGALHSVGAFFAPLPPCSQPPLAPPVRSPHRRRP